MTWDLLERVFMALLICITVGFVVFFVYAIYEDAKSDKFPLRKDQWTCTASHQQSTGKSFVTVCDQWSRK